MIEIEAPLVERKILFTKLTLVWYKARNKRPQVRIKLTGDYLRTQRKISTMISVVSEYSKHFALVAFLQHITYFWLPS